MIVSEEITSGSGSDTVSRYLEGLKLNRAVGFYLLIADVNELRDSLACVDAVEKHEIGVKYKDIEKFYTCAEFLELLGFEVVKVGE